MDVLKLGGEPETIEADPGHAFFEHMVSLAAGDMFDLKTAVNCRLEAAEYLMDAGYTEDLDTALEAVVEREGQIREELASGSA
jgi:hypothetical protein